MKTLSFSFFTNVAIPSFVFACLCFWNYTHYQISSVFDGLKYTYTMTLNIAPMLLIMFLISGQIGVIISQNTEYVQSLLKNSDNIWQTIFASIITPVINSGPIIREHFLNGELAFGYFVALSIAIRVLNVQSMLWMFPIIGWELTLCSMIVGGGIVVIITFLTKITS